MPRDNIDFKAYIFSPEIFRFSLKMFIVWVAASLLIWQFNYFLTRPAKNALETELAPKVTRMYLKGLVQNPEVFWKASELNVQRERLDEAILDMQLAMALLELHKASPTTVARYTQRLAELQETSAKQSNHEASSDGASHLPR